jgi:hypothetical protein
MFKQILEEWTSFQHAAPATLRKPVIPRGTHYAKQGKPALPAQPINPHKRGTRSVDPRGRMKKKFFRHSPSNIM